MGKRPGSGPIGCLLRLIGWIFAAIVLLVLVPIIVLVVVYLSGPRPAPQDVDLFLTATSVGYVQLNLDPDQPAVREYLSAVNDSLVRPRFDRALARAPDYLRPAYRLGAGLFRREVLPRSVPYSLGSLFYDSGRQLKSVRVFNSRLPVSLVRLLDLPRRLLDVRLRRERRVQVRGRNYPMYSAGRALLTSHGNWVVFADSTVLIQEALLGPTGTSPASNELSRLSSAAAGNDQARLVYDNRTRSLRRLLDALELRLIALRPPADREIIAHLFARVIPYSDSIMAVTARGELVSANQAQAQIRFSFTTEPAARRFVSLLAELKPFIDTSLAESDMVLSWTCRPDHLLVDVSANLVGIRPTILRFLTRSRH